MQPRSRFCDCQHHQHIRVCKEVYHPSSQGPQLDSMATMTVTESRAKTRLPKHIKLPPENERFMRACADIASALIQDYEERSDDTKSKRDINLNSLRGQMAKKHHLSNQPPLTAIIAAVPEHYKKYILPKLIAKPIRMSSTSPMLPCSRY